MQIVCFIINQIINETINTKTLMEVIPIIWLEKATVLLVIGTAKVPQIPANKCAGIAPTTSSILNLYNNK